MPSIGWVYALGMSRTASASCRCKIRWMANCRTSMQGSSAAPAAFGRKAAPNPATRERRGIARYPFIQQAVQLAAPAGQQQFPALLRQPGGLPLNVPIGFEVQPRQKKPQNFPGRFGAAAQFSTDRIPCKCPCTAPPDSIPPHPLTIDDVALIVHRFSHSKRCSGSAVVLGRNAHPHFPMPEIGTDTCIVTQMEAEIDVQMKNGGLRLGRRRKRT